LVIFVCNGNKKMSAYNRALPMASYIAAPLVPAKSIDVLAHETLDKVSFYHQAMEYVSGHICFIGHRVNEGLRSIDDTIRNYRLSVYVHSDEINHSLQTGVRRAGTGVALIAIAATAAGCLYMEQDSNQVPCTDAMTTDYSCRQWDGSVLINRGTHWELEGGGGGERPYGLVNTDQAIEDWFNALLNRDSSNNNYSGGNYTSGGVREGGGGGIFEWKYFRWILLFGASAAVVLPVMLKVVRDTPIKK
jgi:hypothetical protein